MRQPVYRDVFEPGSLTTLTGAPDLFGRYPSYASVIQWLHEFVAQPHARLNRPGDVCPRLAPAMDRNLLMFVAIPVADSSVEEAHDKCIHLADLFCDLFTQPDDFRSGALIAIFPGLDRERTPDFIDCGHRLLRMKFVERGLMIGEFHPHSQVASVHNPELLVMRSPVPMFAVRALSVHDLIFLDRQETDPADRVRYLKLFLRHLGDQLGPGTMRRVRKSIAELEEAG